jgi:hypothetical protein
VRRKQHLSIVSNIDEGDLKGMEVEERQSICRAEILCNESSRCSSICNEGRFFA